METQRSIGPTEIDAAFERIVERIVALETDPARLIVAGIANGGVPFGEILAAKLSAAYGVDIPLGQLNITFHRDDLGQNPIPAEKHRTALPRDPGGQTVILADDVISSGRSARAALAELFDLGRPDIVRLVALFDRGGRRLPIQPDVTGIVEEVDPALRVRVRLDPANPSQHEITFSEA